MVTERWLELEGAVNVRDLGGLPLTDGGRTCHGVLLRADNLQDLTRADVDLLVHGHGLRRVVDLRTDVELELEGPGPLTREPAVTIGHHSLYPETGGRTDLDAETVLPWRTGDFDSTLGAGQGETPVVRIYLGYLAHRPDSIVAGARAIAAADGATLVHCAAGKDRTGVVVAVALAAAGVEPDAIVADYAATRERIELIVARLAASPTYTAEIRADDPHSHAPRPETMQRLLEILDERAGGAAEWLRGHGLAEAELDGLRARLRDGSVCRP